ncbi:hypothetical protein CHS0354_017187, partial [Potamilus streckersoni]
QHITTDGGFRQHQYITTIEISLLLKPKRDGYGRWSRTTSVLLTGDGGHHKISHGSVSTEKGFLRNSAHLVPDSVTR